MAGHFPGALPWLDEWLARWAESSVPYNLATHHVCRVCIRKVSNRQFLPSLPTVCVTFGEDVAVGSGMDAVHSLRGGPSQEAQSSERLSDVGVVAQSLAFPEVPPIGECPPPAGLLRQRLSLGLRSKPDGREPDQIDQAQPRAGFRVLPVELLFNEVADI